MGLCVFWYWCISLSKPYLWIDETWVPILYWWSYQQRFTYCHSGDAKTHVWPRRSKVLWCSFCHSSLDWMWWKRYRSYDLLRLNFKYIFYLFDPDWNYSALYKINPFNARWLFWGFSNILMLCCTIAMVISWYFQRFLPRIWIHEYQ